MSRLSPDVIFPERDVWLPTNLIGKPMDCGPAMLPLAPEGCAADLDLSLWPLLPSLPAPPWGPWLLACCSLGPASMTPHPGHSGPQPFVLSNPCDLNHQVNLDPSQHCVLTHGL